MNHDVAHCLNYKKSKCPQNCYRAQVTQDFLELKAAGKIDFPTSWAKFHGTKYCPLNANEEKIK